VSREKDQQYCVHNFDIFKCSVVIFGKDHRKRNAKPLQLLFNWPNQYCYLTLQNKMLAILA